MKKYRVRKFSPLWYTIGIAKVCTLLAVPVIIGVFMYLLTI